MTKKFRCSLFVFRRDLRLEDNTGLIFALKSSEIVIPAFIFTPEQIDHNSFRSDHCLKFMIECLNDLEKQLKDVGGKLYYFKGKPEDIVKKAISKLHVEALILNQDYTPYSRERDAKLAAVCESCNISFYSFHDALLLPPEETLKKDGKPYVIFTPYFQNATKHKVLLPKHVKNSNYFRNSIDFSEDNSILSKILPHQPLNNELIGGRKEALKILKQMASFEDYHKLKDFPAEKCTTHLSPYLKFTVCSPREVYHAICHNLNSHHALIRSLHWRDFFTSIAFFFPHVFKESFHSKFDKLKWSDNQELYQQWCEGLTGIPIVDAGMRELNATGFMHNRVRMITASFLVKDLHINWRWGEKYFAQTLIDYDPAVNNGNWQWIASSGCDAQPYFRIFNPWNQQKKFDPECVYIKKWVPELQDLSSKIIHAWYEKKHHTKCLKYPSPIVDHKKEAQKTLNLYRGSCKTRLSVEVL